MYVPHNTAEAVHLKEANTYRCSRRRDDLAFAATQVGREFHALSVRRVQRRMHNGEMEPTPEASSTLAALSVGDTRASGQDVRGNGARPTNRESEALSLSIVGVVIEFISSCFWSTGDNTGMTFGLLLGGSLCISAVALGTLELLRVRRADAIRGSVLAALIVGAIGTWLPLGYMQYTFDYWCPHYLCLRP